MLVRLDTFLYRPRMLVSQASFEIDCYTLIYVKSNTLKTKLEVHPQFPPPNYLYFTDIVGWKSDITPCDIECVRAQEVHSAMHV